MADVFLSYTSSDRSRADVLRAWFEAAGWSVWWDREIPVGVTWEDSIGRELDAARVVVVLWSPRSRTSEWVLREAEHALAAGKLVQVKAVAALLGTVAPAQGLFRPATSVAPSPLDRHEIVQMAFWFVAVRAEFLRLQRDGQAVAKGVLDEMASSYSALAELLAPIDQESMHELVMMPIESLERLAQ